MLTPDAKLRDIGGTSNKLIIDSHVSEIPSTGSDLTEVYARLDDLESRLDETEQKINGLETVQNQTMEALTCQ